MPTTEDLSDLDFTFRDVPVATFTAPAALDGRRYAAKNAGHHNAMAAADLAREVMAARELKPVARLVTRQDGTPVAIVDLADKMVVVSRYDRACACWTAIGDHGAVEITAAERHVVATAIAAARGA